MKSIPTGAANYFLKRIDELIQKIDHSAGLNNYSPEMLNPLSRKYNLAARKYLTKADIIAIEEKKNTASYRMRHITPTHDVLVLRILPYLCISRNGLRGWINQIESIKKEKFWLQGQSIFLKATATSSF